jgi:hypothetical protein
MSLFSNKHVVAALIISPILALVSYFAVDQVLVELPQLAQAGQSYPLLAKSNCRYESGRCDLRNADFQASLTVTTSKGGDEVTRQVLQLTTSHIVQDIKVGFKDVKSQHENDSGAPQSMSRADDNKKSWSHIMPMPVSLNTQLMIVIFSNGVRYYADTTMGFSEYKTSFNKNFKAE